MNKTKQNKTKQNKTTTTISLTNLLSFKLFIALLSLILFSISCSNEGTTGGNDTGNNDDTGNNFNYFTVSENWNNSKDITLVSETSSSKVYSAGTVGFTVTGASDYTISIESVAQMSVSLPLALGTSDFSYNQSSKDLRLSSSGLSKFQTAKDSFTETQKYAYRITFKIATSSESKNVNVIVNLIKAKVVSKTEIETIMKTVKRKSDWLISGTPNAGEIIIAGTSSSDNTVKFSFASASFSPSNPNFSSTGTTTTSSTSINIATSKAAETLADAINDNTEFGKYFSNFLGVESSATPKISGKDCTFTLKFKKVKSGYALSSEVSRLTTSGLTIGLTLKDDGSKTARWK